MPKTELGYYFASPEQLAISQINAAKLDCVWSGESVFNLVTFDRDNSFEHFEQVLIKHGAEYKKINKLLSYLVPSSLELYSDSDFHYSNTSPTTSSSTDTNFDAPRISTKITKRNIDVQNNEQYCLVKIEVLCCQLGTFVEAISTGKSNNSTLQLIADSMLQIGAAKSQLSPIAAIVAQLKNS